MKRPNVALHWQTTSDRPVSLGDLTVTPQSRALVVRLPFGGFVWNRPTSIIVERGGRQECIRIVDVTRLLQAGLVGLVIVALLGLTKRRGAVVRRKR